MPKVLQSHLLVPCCWQILLRGRRDTVGSGARAVQAPDFCHSSSWVLPDTSGTAATGAPGASAGSKEHPNVRARAKSGGMQRGVKGKALSHVPAARGAGSVLATSWQGQDRAVSHQDVSWSRQQEQAEASLPMAVGYLGHAARCLMCPKAMPVPRRCPGMTAPSRGRRWPSAGGRWNERLRARVPVAPARASPFMRLCLHHH